MPTYWSQTLIPTSREVPAEAEVPSHQLMLRAGLIRKIGAGVYDYLPLGLRALQKAMKIIREEMAAAGATEVLLPALVPIEFYQQTGRDQAYGDNLFRLKDRHGRLNALGPTHEEIVTELVGAYVESYKQLPLTLYQIQTKFRDEFRPRFGVLRSREFLMKDAYSFHTAVEGPGGLNEIYDKQYAAYERIFKRCGLPYLTVEAESGPIGGSASHEFMVPSPTGEDTILESDKGNYAANVEKAEIGARAMPETFVPYKAKGLQSLDPIPAAPPSGALEKVHTPNCPRIEDVSAFMKVKPKHMLKTLVYVIPNREAVWNFGATEEESHFDDPIRGFVIAVVRGDQEVNDGKLKNVVGQDVELANEVVARAAGFTIGFVGPQAAVSNPEVRLVIDVSALADQFWVTGANEADHHAKYFNWKRDVIDALGSHAKDRIVVADIRNAADGDPSPKNDGGILRTRKGIEIGHVFKLGDKYTRAMGVTVLGADNTRMHPLMGCYGIGVNRILAAAIERDGGHDNDGMIWPAAIAPYSVLITPIRYEGPIKEAACGLASALESAGLDVLIDDRDERPGVKFKDADLVGFPVRVTIGDKSLAEGKVEVKARNGSNGAKGELVAMDQAAAHITAMLKNL
ncbi:MAG: proline--tRNA ligase [Planctomycetes bacterium]|nr:proline--tRNA ligase [Planctomycetota bacterium]